MKEEIIKEFDKYQSIVHLNAVYSAPNDTVIERLGYVTIGLCGETGEIANKVKKVIRDGKELDMEDTIKELGDVLWYLSEFAASVGISLSTVANRNIKKLEDRRSRDKLHGFGDDR